MSVYEESYEDSESAGICGSIRTQQCFSAAIEYFHSLLDKQIRDHSTEGTHPERPTTAREYFKQKRDWNDSTIERQLLGWAPSENENSLVTHLQGEGFGDDELLSTGLFTEDLRPLWNGRYVIPYLDEVGKPIYAISRTTGESGDVDGHPDDFMSGKYANPAHTKEYSSIEKPIFGLHTVRSGEPLVITEGIADAITVHQEGYPCISPVTTRFKKSDLEEICVALEKAEVTQVYVLQDAERPTSKYNEQTGELNIAQFGPGITGAVDTALYLSENGIDARVNTPPRPGLSKVDLDDYLRDGWGKLDALVRSAKPPHVHPAFSTATVSETTSYDQPSKSNSKGQRSKLWDLDITDVSSLYINYRGINPLGHTGKRRDYFVVYKRDGEAYAFDHELQVEYNALTFLLCEAGIRPKDAPNGPLDYKEKFIAWKQAKETGVLSSSDPIPQDGLIHIVLSHGLCEKDELDGRTIPPEAYNKALDVVRDEYNLNPGREPIGSEYRRYSLGKLSTTSDDSTELPEISLEEARKRCETTLGRALSENKFSLIDALPAQGKSYGIVKWAAESGQPLTVLASRHDLYDQSRNWATDLGLSTYTLPAFHRDCGSATGEHGKRWKQRVWDLYDAGATGGEIHALAERKFGEPLPCQRHGQCDYLSKGKFNPEDYDVILGHYTHAYRSDVVEGRVVAIDEAPTDAFLHEFTHEEVVSPVNYFLNRNGEIPFDGYKDLLENRSDPYRKGDAITWFQEHNNGVNRDGSAVMNDWTGHAHALAPLMVYALVVGEDLGNRWEHASLPENRVAARDSESDSSFGESELTLLLPPMLDEAHNVIGLDGTPWTTQWELCLGTSLSHYPVLSDEERAGYLQNALKLSIYQMSSDAKPYSSGTWVKPEQDSALIRQVGEWERRRPDLITSKGAMEKYELEGILEFVGAYEHYGNLKGSNLFKRSRLGIVVGSCHYGDKYIQKWSALAGRGVTRIGDGRGMELDYGPFGNKILQSMREHEVLQAVMRFGRDGNGATVYVSTAALPDWIALRGRGEVFRWSDGMRQVLDALHGMKEWKTSDLLITTDDGKQVLDTDSSDRISERQVRRNLQRLYELGFLNREKSGTGWLWIDSKLSKIQEVYQVVRHGANN